MKLTITRQYNSNSVAISSIEFECLIFDSTILETRRLFHLTGDQIRELIFWMKKKTAQNRKSQPLFCGFFVFHFLVFIQLSALRLIYSIVCKSTTNVSIFVFSLSLSLQSLSCWLWWTWVLQWRASSQQRHDEYEIEKIHFIGKFEIIEFCCHFIVSTNNLAVLLFHHHTKEK